jgi:hypothetical protein
MDDFSFKSIGSDKFIQKIYHLDLGIICKYQKTYFITSYIKHSALDNFIFIM